MNIIYKWTRAAA